MMNRNKIIYLFYLFAFATHLLFSYTIKSSDLAFVCVPVADLLGEPVQCTPSFNEFQKLPVCPESPGAGGSYARIQQLLFNEIVKIIQTKNDQAEVEIFHLFYLKAPDFTTPHTRYWTQMSNLQRFSELPRAVHAIVPHQINFQKKTDNLHRPSLVLTMPWKDPASGLHFSAGTRFVMTNDQPSKKKYSVYIFDKAHNRVCITSIARSLCFYAPQACKIKDRIEAFVTLLKKWANLTTGFIPYVWGGASFVHLCNHNTPFIKQKTEQSSFFSRPCCSDTPKTGFDCTSLVARAAQICDIPYFCKNSSTALHVLKTIEPGMPLSAGDLIWIPGHIMVVSDLEKNLIIEARHYSNGYGKVHEIPLDKQFKGIKTFQDLQQVLRENKPLERLDSTGRVATTLNSCKILSLKSLWNDQ